MMKGSYILLIQLPKEQTIQIGSLLDIYFPSGYYAYVGSAMGGLESRLNRHLKQDKKLHWHIDYLLQQASISGVIVCQSRQKVECDIAQALSRQFDYIPGFGATDCHCRSHLFFSSNKVRLKSAIMTIIKSLAMKLRLIEKCQLTPSEVELISRVPPANRGEK